MPFPNNDEQPHSLPKQSLLARKQRGRRGNRSPDAPAVASRRLSDYATWVFGASFSLDFPKNTSYQHRKQ